MQIHEVIGLDIKDNWYLDAWREILRREVSPHVGLMLVLFFKFRGRNFFKEGRI